MFSTSSSLVTVINASKSSFGNWYFTHISGFLPCCWNMVFLPEKGCEKNSRFGARSDLAWKKLARYGLI
ncbi:hypothetical protein HanXRQr2_Chr15g0698961 [Helianthus annuus]|uniref:Uncharacterized protein n=1 Tax=Helianthus annuus TaxID=4232 RepID=A0A9K3E2E0_HELAN|nr:hypothetical protein HanXRQr2_Chr15g0698961 [Helianthus annuus]KAJ0831746.1 hypothetical protein HanPSC8_Chr15g0670671 [Helianthus annuus]